MSKIDKIPVRMYEGSVEDRQFLSKDEALRYVTDFFNREADKIDQKYNDSNDTCWSNCTGSNQCH